MKKMHRFFMILLVFMGVSMPVMAQSPAQSSKLEAFFNAMLQASKLETCEETEKALKAMPQDMLESAIYELKTLTDQAVAEQYQAKLQEMMRLSGRCPEIQDAFAQRFSRLFIKVQVNRPIEQGERLKAIDDLKQFASESFSSIVASDCGKSAQNFQKISSELCSRALVGFKTVERASLNASEQSQIAEKLEQVMVFAQKCPEFEEQYRRCLYGKRETEDDLPLSHIEPFLVWVEGLQRLLSSHGCSGIDKAISDYAETDQFNAAKRALSGIRPAQFSPQDRQVIKAKMKAVYQTLPGCEAARTGIDRAIESMF